jgi:hypothetical protein
VTEYRLVAGPRVDLDVAAAYQWYENEEPGPGWAFLDQLLATYDRIVIGPRRFPYAVYFAVEGDAIVVLAILHASRDPAEWQRRGG